MESAIAMLLLLCACCICGVIAIALICASPWILVGAVRWVMRLVTDYAEHRSRRTTVALPTLMAASAGAVKLNRFDHWHLNALNAKGLARHKQIMEAPLADRGRVQIEHWRQEHGTSDTLEVYDRSGAVLTCLRDERVVVANLRDRGLAKPRAT